MLAGEVVVLGIEQHALVAAGITEHRGAELRAVSAAHHESADRVCAVIDSEGEHGWERTGGQWLEIECVSLE